MADNMEVILLKIDSYVRLAVSHEGVGILEIDRPQKKNALSQAVIDDLIGAISDAEKDERVRCVVLTSSEGGPFSAGADLSELVHIGTSEAHEREYLKDLNDAISLMRKPIVAAVNGFALGGGFELAMMCDIIYAADNAKFGLPELTVGTMPGAGGTQRLTRLIGKHKAMDLILTSSTISATELHNLGGISRIFPAEEVRAAAITCARTIASRSSPVVKFAKHSILHAEQTDLQTGMKLERALYYASFNTRDKQEGMTAFVEKRAAVFKHC